MYIIAACLLVIISYLDNLFSTTGIPSVLLLLVTGITIREVLLYRNAFFNIPGQTVELFGILGLIMIVLEAHRLSKFNEGILFFVALTTSIMMMIGSIAYGRPKLQTINDELPLLRDNI